MPVAVFNYLFAQLYRREPAEVAGMIVISTLISFARSRPPAAGVVTLRHRPSIDP